METTNQLIKGNGYLQAYNDMLSVMLEYQAENPGNGKVLGEIMEKVKQLMEIRESTNWAHESFE